LSALIARQQDAEKAKEIEDRLDGVEQRERATALADPTGVQARVFRFDW